MKIALVYDWIDKQGGVERLLTQLMHVYPDAHLYTSIYNAEAAPWAKGLPIRTSFLQGFPSFIKKNRALLAPFLPFAFESFNFSEYDVVISITSSFAKGIITRPETKHICVLLTPTRFLWDLKTDYQRSSFFNIVAAPLLSQLRKWDSIAAQRPDSIIAISNLVAQRCLKTYHRVARVVFPSFDTAYWGSITPEAVPVPAQYYLVVARLEPYKRIDLVIDTFKELPAEHLIIVGTGSEYESLKERAGKNVEFRTGISDQNLAYLYSHARALIMPQEEDFGYTALEGLYFNCPVISYKESGAAEVVVEGKTGILFSEQSVSGLRTALERSASLTYNVSSSKEGILKQFSQSGLLEIINY